MAPPVSEKSPTDVNREAWEKRLAQHLKSEFYDLPGFLAGTCSLKSIELAELGPVTGASLLHLQCHFGQDTLSWARRGARVTGVDFSPAAIDQARNLAAQIGVDARFVCADVMTLDQDSQQLGKFDYVFTSYGVLGWLSDLDLWGRAVARHLKPGGVFYLVEFHPVLWQFDPETAQVIYPYFDPNPQRETIDSTYTDKGKFDQPVAEYYWTYTISSAINALLRAGLELEFVHEFNFSPYPLRDHMVELGCERYVLKSMGNIIPYLFSLRARRPS